MATQYVKVLDSAARTTDVTSVNFHAYEDHNAGQFILDVTGGSAFNLGVAIRGYDPLSLKSYTLLSQTINASGTSVLRVGPELTAAAGIAKDYLPAYWNVQVTVSGGISSTFSVGAHIM